VELTLEEVQRVALLARLRLTSEEEAQLTSQLTKILHYMDKLGALDTSGIEPFTHALDNVPALREDKVSNTPDPDNLLANAPAKEQTFFRVPKIIE
jgi:aspartyl-tRNA(Asn)/glutamyl-tRNA(Gln) amidotransferase subunit C